MKHGNQPIPKLCHAIWKLYCELDNKYPFFAEGEKEKHTKKILRAEAELLDLLEIEAPLNEQAMETLDDDK